MAVLAVVGVVGVAGAWVVTPLASMMRKGTIDQQTVDGWRVEADRAAAVSRARRRSALVAAIPAPRGAEHDQRRSPVGG